MPGYLREGPSGGVMEPRVFPRVARPRPDVVLERAVLPAGVTGLTYSLGRFAQNKGQDGSGRSFPATFIAVAIIEATSATFAGRIVVVEALASSPNFSM